MKMRKPRSGTRKSGGLAMHSQDSVQGGFTGTRDGVSAADWTKLFGYAEEYLNAEDKIDKERASRARILRFVRFLEKKYGKKASLLATKADYLVKNGRRRMLLWTDAFRIAESADDHLNCVYVAASVIEFLRESDCDPATITSWLSKLRAALRKRPDDYAEGVATETETMLLSRG